MRKAYMTVVLAAAVLLAGVSTGARRQVATSARSFERYFTELKGASGSMGPLERVVFSLVLAGADHHRAETENR